MEEAHGDGLGTLLTDDVDRLVEGVDVERDDDLAVGSDALLHLEAQVAVDEGLRRGVEQAVQGGHAHPSQLKDIAEALGGYEGGLRALAFQDGVGGDGGAVDDLFDGLDGDLLLGKELSHALDDAA